MRKILLIINKIIDFLGEILAVIALILLYFSLMYKSNNPILYQILITTGAVLAILGILTLLLMSYQEHASSRKTDTNHEEDLGLHVTTDILGLIALGIVLTLIIIELI